MEKASTVFGAFREGQQARREKKPETDNPHTDRRLKEAWGAGWRTENRFLLGRKE
jgi:hypothetical protein